MKFNVCLRIEFRFVEGWSEGGFFKLKSLAVVIWRGSTYGKGLIAITLAPFVF